MSGNVFYILNKIANVRGKVIVNRCVQHLSGGGFALPDLQG